jgi:hypothetical protein
MTRAGSAALFLAALAGCGSDESAAPDVMIGAPGVRVTGVAIYQGPERMLVVDGAEVAGAVPLVAGRDAVVRVLYHTDAAYDGAPVTAALVLSGERFAIETTLFEGSSSVVAASTPSFDVPGDRIVPGATYRVALTQLGAASAENAAARHPAAGEAALPDVHAAHRLRVMVVPFRYDADGSGRLPDVSEAQLERYRRVLYTLYPVAEVEIAVHDVVPLATPLAVIDDWLTFVDTVVDLRAADSPDPGVYYYGVAAPVEALTSYTGFPDGIAATVDMPEDPALRAAVGLGFSGEAMGSLMAHELGHVHGRRHAPCGGAAGPDPMFPYPAGGVGVTFYDVTRKLLVAPDGIFDLMGYCDPRWISDYNYIAIDGTIHLVEAMTTQSLADVRYARFSLHADGSVHRLAPVTRRSLDPARAVTWEVSLADGSTRRLDGWLSAFDHAPGGIVHLALPADADVVALERAAQ